jgi:hypothetical protein
MIKRFTRGLIVFLFAYGIVLLQQAVAAMPGHVT